MFKEDLNRIEVDNIRLVVDYYDHKRVITKVDYIKHLIARKKIVVDMKSKPLDFGAGGGKICKHTGGRNLHLSQ